MGRRSMSRDLFFIRQLWGGTSHCGIAMDRMTSHRGPRKSHCCKEVGTFWHRRDVHSVNPEVFPQRV